MWALVILNIYFLPPMAKPVTLYVSDLDGTLLGADSLLSDESVQRLNNAIHRYGALFTCATARTPATIVPLMRRVDVKLPMIAMAGAAMWSQAEAAYKHVRSIPEQVIEQVVAIYARHGARPFVYRQCGSVIEAYHCVTLSQQERDFVNPRSSGPMKRFVLGEGFGDASHEAMIVFSIDRYNLLRDVYNEIVATVDCSPVCYHDIFDPEYGILEVYSQGTTKAHAIATLAREVGADRIVVFGDNRNDLPMMAIAHHSVAVANAVPEVLSQAREVIGANTEHSVARWIEEDARRIAEGEAL